jgi:hypothetical protein
MDPHQLRRGISSFNQRPNLGQKQKEKVMQQLGRIALQLSSLQFNKIGSLFEDAGEYRVGKCLSPAFIFHDQETLRDVPRGPFERNDDYYNAMLSALHFFYMFKSSDYSTMSFLRRFQSAKNSRHLKATILQFADGRILSQWVVRLTAAEIG